MASFVKDSFWQHLIDTGMICEKEYFSRKNLQK